MCKFGKKFCCCLFVFYYIFIICSVLYMYNLFVVVVVSRCGWSFQRLTCICSSLFSLSLSLSLFIFNHCPLLHPSSSSNLPDKIFIFIYIYIFIFWMIHDQQLLLRRSISWWHRKISMEHGGNGEDCRLHAGRR